MSRERTQDTVPVGVIPIHFEVSAHVVALETFIATAQSTREIIETFNRNLLQGQLRYEIYVLPAEEGSLKSKLAVYVTGGIVAFWAFVTSDIGKAFVEGLTGSTPEQIARDAGKSIRRYAVEAFKSAEVLQKEAIEADELEGTTAVIVESTKSFLQRRKEELRKVGIDERWFRDAFEARNEFYSACHNNPDVVAVGFDEEPVFPIRRSDFIQLQVSLPPRDEPKILEPWNVEVVALNVTSPNWDRNDRQRTWKARDANGKERHFLIEDEYFWVRVRDGTINPTIIDKIKVQWAFLSDRRRTPRVLKVLEYNDEALGVPLDGAALEAILGLFSAVDRSQGELFGQS